MANTLLGSGMLGLPAAYARCGYVTGSLMLVVCGFSGAFGLHLLSEGANLAGRPASFYGLAEAALPGSGIFLDLAVSIKCFGVATSYLIVVSDTMPDLMAAWGQTGILRDRRFWILAALLVAGPLTFLRDLSAQRHAAYAAIVCVLFTVLTVALSAWRPISFLDPYDPDCLDCAGVVLPATSWKNSLASLPVFVFSYTCHQNIISITNELRDPTTLRAAMVGLLSNLIAFACYLILAFAGYVTFGSKVLPDVLRSYSDEAVLPNISRVAIVFLVTVSYPLQSHPTRLSVLSLLKVMFRRCKCDFDVKSQFWFHVTTVAFLTTSTALAMSISDLGVVLRFVGATGSTIVQYIVPGACYFVLQRGSNSVTRWMSLVHFLLGLCIMFGSLVLIAYDV